MDDTDETVAWLRAHGPTPLLLDGWDRSSTWGWDESTSSLYAHLWRNTEDTARAPSVRIGADEFTSPITYPETLAQHIAMAVGCNPWQVLTALLRVDAQEQHRHDGHENATDRDAATVVTIAKGHDLWWPPEATG